jgi:hypothetical protein
MPKSALTQEFRLTTRNDMTHVECVITVAIDGRELPNLEVMGKALEAATEQIKTTVKESYVKVPERV